jgi:mannose-6-phosphate isomerase-like protein (cupin superfamily)
MIRKENKMKTETKEKMREGEGQVSICHMISKEEMAGGRLFAKLTLPPGASIGPHRHEGETEYYAIISGWGEVTEDDGKKKVAAGDIVVTGDGESHSIANIGEEPLVFIAVIVYDRDL